MHLRSSANYPGLCEGGSCRAREDFENYSEYSVSLLPASCHFSRYFTFTTTMYRLARTALTCAPSRSTAVLPAARRSVSSPLHSSPPLSLSRKQSKQPLTFASFDRSFTNAIQGEGPVSLYTLTDEEIMLRDSGEFHLPLYPALSRLSAIVSPSPTSNASFCRRTI